jgi:hypothetical protein
MFLELKGAQRRATQLSFNTNGTTNLSDISNARVFYTGGSPNFDSSFQYGSTVSAPSGAFSVSGNQPLMVGVNYFWLTYDVSNSSGAAGNFIDAECTQLVDSFIYNKTPLVTAPSGSRKIQPPLSGNYTIGVTGDFPTLTQALASLSSLGAVGPVTFSLIDANYPSEVFPISITSYPGMSSINTLTIRPDATASNVLIQNNNITSGVFVINGAKYVTIDGRPGGVGTSRGLHLVNFALANFSVISFLNDANSCNVKYCNIRSSNTALSGANSGSIYIGNSNGFSGNDSITISNNYFAGTSLGKHANSIYSQGQSANVQNNNISITQNEFNGFSLNGVFCNGTGNGSYWSVNENSFYDTLANTAYNSTWTSINLAPSSASAANYYEIRNNFIGGTAPLCGGTPLTNSTSITRQGILLNAATGPANTIYGNTISNIVINGTGTSQFTGISVTSGAVNIDSNTIGSLTVPNSIYQYSKNVFLGINSTPTGVNVSVTRNVIANITHNNVSTSGGIRGMNIGGSGINTISNNIIKALTTNSANAGTTTTPSMAGIICSGSGTNNISNNQIGGGLSEPLVNNCSTTAAVRITGIYASTGVNTISGNTLDGLRLSSTATTTVGTTTTANMLGICVASGTSGQVISNNNIRHLYINSTAAAQTTQLNAILYASSGSHTISGNNIYGIYTRSSNVNTATSSALNLIMVSSSGISTITNNVIDSVSLSTPTAAATTTNCIYVVGSAGNLVSGNIIKSVYTNSTQTNTSFGLLGITLTSSVINQSVINNKIYNFVNTNTAAVTSSIVGIRMISSTSLSGNSNFISRNLIHSFRAASTGIATITGIQNAQGVNYFSNNMIRLGLDSTGAGFAGPFVIYGIHDNYTASNIPSYYYNNSVYLGGSPASGTSLTAAFLSANSSRPLTIKNNIFVNSILNGGSSTAQHHALRINSTFNISSNYNILFAPNASGFIASTMYLQQLTIPIYLVLVVGLMLLNLMVKVETLIQILFLQQVAVALVDLHLNTSNPAEGGADPNTSTFLTVDYDGADRSGLTPSDIGAHAGNFTLSKDTMAPTIMFTPLTNTATLSNRELTVTIIDNGGVPNSVSNPVRPRLYYRKNGGTWYSSASTLTSGTSRNGVYTMLFDYTSVSGVIPGDQIQYYVIAQDSSSNLSSSPLLAIATDVNTVATAPASLNTYLISSPLDTILIVGSAPSNYTNLTNAFAAINNGVLQGNTVIYLKPGTIAETSPTLNQWLEIKNGTMGNYDYTLTVRPQSSSLVTLTGAGITLNGADRVTILGYDTLGSANDSNLIVSTTGTALNLTNDASRNVFSNVIFAGGSLVVNIGGGTVTGNDNLTFNRCKFRPNTTSTIPNYLFFNSGTTGKENDTLLVQECDIYIASTYQMYFGGGIGNMIRIKDNQLFQPITTGLISNILFQPGVNSNNDTISGNYIGGTARLAGGTPELNSYTSQHVAIYISQVGSQTGVHIANNVIKNITMTSTGYFYGIYLPSGVSNVIGNMFGDTASASPKGITIGAATIQSYGIYGASSSPITIKNNIISSITSSGNNAFAGIYNGGGVTQINNNLVQNLSNTNVAGTSVRLIGIQSSAASIAEINNNTIKNFTCNSANTGTTTSQAVLGIMNNGATAISIQNNVIRNLVNTNNTASNGMTGILHASGLGALNGNTIEDLTTGSIYTGTTTSAPLVGLYSSSSTQSQSFTNNTIRNIILNGATTASKQVIGMLISGGGQHTVTGNTIQSIKTNSSSTSTTISSSVIGLYLSVSSAQMQVSNNTIGVLENTYTAAANANNIIGMYYTNSVTTGTNSIERNFIHSLKLSSSGAGTMTGMYVANSTNGTFANNMIRLGVDSAGTEFNNPYNVNGILLATGNVNQFLHNTVFLAGTPSSGTSLTYGFQMTASSTSMVIIKNNIFQNEVLSAGSTGKNYALKYASANNLNSNYNLLFTQTDPYSFLGAIGVTDYVNLAGAASWHLGTGLDYNSGFANAQFLNSRGTGTDLDLKLAGTNPSEANGDNTVTSVSLDYFGNARSALSPSDIGAYAGSNTRGVDAFAPIISITPINNTGDAVGPMIVSGITVTDAQGIYTSGSLTPKLYVKKGQNGTFTALSPSSITGTSRSTNLEFSIAYPALGGVSVNDSIFYYLVVQDSAGNICSAPNYAVATSVNAVISDPSTLGMYRILPAIAGGTKFYVGSGQTYTSFTNTGGLFEYLNNNAIGGDITAVVTSNINGETGNVALNQIGETGLGSGTFSITIRPDSSASGIRTIAGNAIQGLFRLNGVDRLKINGVPDLSSNNSLQLLRLRNGSTSSPTIYFTNGAQGNKISNVIIEGSNTTGNLVGSGVISFGNPSGLDGNSNDSIVNCHVRNNSSLTAPLGVPTIAIQSSSTSLSKLNSNIYIYGNNIYNIGAYGINTEVGTGGNWVISNNSFYNDLISPPNSLGISVMSIRINAGLLSEGNYITGNYIGGQAANCGGSAWTNNLNVSFQGIVYNGGNDQMSYIQNNTIQNINLTSTSTSAQFIGINHVGGRLTIGGSLVSGNQFGAPGVSNSIMSNGATTHSVITSGSGVASVPLIITHNNIQGMTFNNLGSSGGFIGISAAGGMLQLNNNTIGHASFPASISSNLNGAIRGVVVSTAVGVAPTTSITNNVIANIVANGTGNSVSLNGITMTGTSVTAVTGNSIYNLSTNSANSTSGVGANSAVVGILYNASGAPEGSVINDNQIYNLEAANTGAYVTNVSAISVSGPISMNIQRNKIYDIKNQSTSTSVNPMATANGILFGTFNSYVNLYNNQISLGNGVTSNVQFNGIWGGTTNSSMYVYAMYNSVLISGTVSSGSLASYAFHRGNNTTGEISYNLRLTNNVLVNARSGGSSKNYAIANEVSGTANGTGWASSGIDYNLLGSSSSNSVGLWAGSNLSISQWRTLSSGDNNSYFDLTGTGTNEINISALFPNYTSGNLEPDNNSNLCWYLNGKGVAGATSNNLATDYEGNSRGTTLGFGSDIGAFEFATSTTPPSAVLSGTMAVGQTQTITFANKEIGSITWVSGTLPSALNIKYYSGVEPPVQTSPIQYLNTYWDMSATGGSGYQFNLTLTYPDALIGTLGSKSYLNTVRKIGSGTWSTLPVPSVSNTSTNRLVNTSNISAFGLFTGTDQCSDVPDIDGEDTICAGATFAYSIPYLSGHIYRWTAPGGTFVGGNDTSAVSITWGTGSTRTLMAFDSIPGSRCQLTSTKTIRIFDYPAPVISGNTTVCENTNVAYSTPSSSLNSYNWVVSGGVISAGQGTANVTVTWGSSGAGSLIVTDSLTATGCKTTTTAYNVTINPVIASNTITSPQTICTGSTPSSLTGSTPTGGNGTYTYTWLSSTTSASTGFAAASGTNNAKDYAPSTLTETIWYKRVVSAGVCSQDTSAAIMITVNPVIASNTISGVQTICSGTAAASLTGSTPTGGNGSYTYAWESSTTSASTGFSAASGTNTTIDYMPGTLTATTWYRRVVSAGVCASSTSSAIEVTVNPVIASNTISSNQTICTGSVPSSITGSTPTGGNSTYTYAWESSTTSASSGFSAASGINNAADYSPSALTATTWFRRVVSAGVCTSNTSSAIEVTVNPVLSNNSISSAQTICTGSTPSTLTGSTATGGNGSIAYLWESSTTSASAGFSAASGTNSNADYSPSSLTATTWYRRKVSAGVCPSITTSAIEITVNPVISNNTISSAQTICTGSTPSSLTGSTATGGNGSITYLWESSTTSASAGFSAASGTNNTQGYTPGSLTATTWYRRVVSAGVCTANTSTAIEITVNPLLSSNSISGAQTICTGSSASTLSGSTPTGGNGTFTYLWESSTTSASSGFSSASGTNNAIDYNSSSLTATTWFRRVVSAGVCPSITSSAIEVTVNPVISNNTISSAQTICTGSTPSTLTGSTATGGNGSITYLWESSTTSATSGFSAASGTNNNADYSPGSLTATTWYRRKVSAGVCPSNTTVAIEITVNSLITNNTASSPAQVCVGTATETLNGGLPAGGNGSYVYLWESSTTSASSGFSAASGTNSNQNYIPDVLTQTTWFRRTVTAGICPSTTSTAVMAQVNSYPTPVISGTTSICENNSAAYSIGLNSGRAYTWAANGGTITGGQGTNSITVLWGAAGASSVMVTDSITATGCATTTTPYSVTKNAYPTPVITGSNTVCSFSTTSFSTPSNSGRTYTWHVTGGIIASGQGTSSIQIDWAAPGSGTVSVTDSVNATGCSVTTSNFNVSINNSPSPVITGVSGICHNNTATYSTPFNAGSAYIWDVTGGVITAGANTNSITIQWNTVGAGSVIVTDSIMAGGCKTTTSPYSVTVNPYPTPVVSGNNLVCINTSHTYSISSNTGRTYLWSISGGTITSGQGTASVDVLWNTSGVGTLVASDSVNATGCKTVSSIYNVTVNPAIASNSVTSSQTICSGASASTLIGSTPTGGNSTYTYLWESSTTSATTGFAAASGANTGADYNTGVLTASTWYRRVVNAGVCSASTSSAIAITVNPVIANNTIGSAQTICHNTIPTSLTGTVATGGNGTYTYLWESSTTSSSSGFAAASGTNSGLNYAPASLGQTTWYRRTVNAGVCTPLVSSAVKITVQDTTKPTVVVNNITRYLNTSGLVSITANEVDNGSTDNCGISTRVLSKTNFSCTNMGANNVYLTVIDLIGNKDSSLAIVTIMDTILPVIQTQPYTAYLNASGSAAISVVNVDNGTFDNCGISTMSLSKTSFNCSNVGSNNVTLTVTDVNGNVRTASVAVTVSDTVKPIVNVTNGIVLYLNASANIPITTSMINNGSSDNCGIASMSVSPSSINCTHIGITPVTLTVTDVNGNVNSSVTNVVVFDPIVPVARPKARINAYLSSTGQTVINAAMLDSASSDNCTITSKTISQSTFNCAHLGDNTISFTVQDQSGNSNAVNAIVAILDTISPTANAQNVTIYLNGSGVATLAASQVNAGSTDNCGVSVTSISKTSFNSSNLGNNAVSFTATDASNNSASVNITVTVLDTMKPVAISQNRTIYLNGSGNASITAAAVNNGSTDNVGVTSLSLNTTSFNCSNVGSNNVTLTVSDISGNMSTANAIITVLDTVKPNAVAQNITVYLDATGNASISGSQVNNGSTDNCSVASYGLSKSTFNCTNLGSNNVVLTVTDGSGNFRTANSNVTVLDTVKPVANVNANVNLYLNASGNATLTTTMVNNGSTDNCGIATLGLSKTAFNGTNLGSNSVNFTITDNSSNSKVVSFTVNVLDTMKPTAISQNRTIYLDGTGNASIAASSVNNGSTDNVGVTSLSLSKSTFNCSNIGSNLVVLTVGDVSSNTQTATATVTVLDTIKPIAVANNVTLYLDNNGLAGLTTTQVNNGSSDNCIIATMTLSKSSFNCTNLGSNNVSFTVTDGSGNFRTVNSLVTVLDTVKPTIAYSNNLNLYLNATGTATLTTSMVNNGSSDNCGISSMVLSKTSFTGADRGTNVVTFTVADASTNSRAASVNIIVIDSMKPLAAAQNRTIYVDGTGNASITAALVNNGSTDNVGVTSLSLSKTNYNCTNLGQNSVVLTVGDASGNVSTANAIVTVLDTIKPLVTSQNLTVYINALGSASISASQINNGSTDNCGISTITLSKSSFDCTNLGTNNVGLTVTDASGNFRTVNAIVTVSDTTKPTVVINNNLNLYLNALGTATLTTSMVNNGSSDNCSISSMVLSKTTFTGADRGLNLVNFTVTDGSTNNRVVVVNVNVIDSMKPVAAAQNRTIYVDGTGNASITAALVNNGSTDNVGVTSLSLSKTNYNCTNLGQNSVVLTVGDASSNVSTANAIVTVLDTIKPLVTSQNLTVYINALGSASISASQINNGSTDNCGISTITLSKSSFDCTNLGANNVGLTVTDASGNFRTVNAIVTVSDTTKPTVVINNNLNLYLNALGTATLTTSMVNNGSSDNCSISSMVLSKTTFTGADRGLNLVNFTVTDGSTNNRVVVVNVIVIDSMKPTAVAQNITAYLNTAGTVTITPAQVNNGSTDNVGVTSLSLNQTTFNCLSLGNNSVTLTVGDASGNTSTASAIVNVMDTIKPIAVSQNLTIQLNQLGVASITNSQVNNGSTDNCGISTIVLSKSSFDCSNIGSNNVLMTVTDASGNFRTVSATITVQDTVKPIPAINNNLSLYLNASGAATLTTSMVNNGSSDNCGIASMSLSKTSFTGADRGLNVVTFTVTDNSSNSRAVSVNINVIDSMRPIAIAQNRTIYLNGSGQASITAAAVNNGSTDNVGVTTLSLNATNFTCNDLGANNVTLTVGDASGNFTTANAIITVVDSVKPVASARNLTVYLNQFGNASITTGQANNGSSDNCGTLSLALSTSAFDCSNLGTNNIVLTATDGSNNSSTANLVVTVVDTLKPIASVNNNISVYLDATGNVSLGVNEVDNGSYDNCTIATRVLSKTNFNGTNLGLNVVSFTITDQSSNSKSVNVNVFVRDTMLPIIKGKNLSIYLSASGSASINTTMVDDGSSDNVGITYRNLSKLNFNCTNVGPNSVLYTLRDASGNETVGEVTITVVDTILPVLVSKPNNKVVGFCNDIITYSMPTASDNCSGLTVTQTTGLPSGSRFPVGLTNNVFDIVDASGNIISTSFTVLVLPEIIVDTFPSLEMCQDNGTLDLSHGFSNFTFAGPGMKKDKITFDPILSGTGTHSITGSFLDSMGCVSTGTFTITVYPVPEKPEIVRISSNILSAQKDYNSYQWYRNNVLMPGATGKTLTVTQSGVYGLVVRNTSGCINGSDPYAIGTTGVGSGLVKDKDMFNVYPNPSSGIFYIELKGMDVKGSRITIIDMLGKEVRSFEPDKDLIEMNVVDFAPGTYFVKMENGNKFMVKPLVIAK